MCWCNCRRYVVILECVVLILFVIAKVIVDATVIAGVAVVVVGILEV